jgi:hypothetical protein
MDLSRAFLEGSGKLDLSSLAGCYRLQSLNVSNADNLSGLARLFRTGCPRLHTFIAKDCQFVDDELVRSVFSDAAPCIRDGVLKRIDLAGCGKLTDSALISVVGAVKAQLTTLKMGRCPLLTDASVAYVAENCPRLAELDIDRLEGLSIQTVFGRLILNRQNCPELVTLTISGIKLLESGPDELGFQSWAGDIAAHASRYGPEFSITSGHLQLPVRAPKTAPSTSLKSLNLSGISFLTAPVMHILLAYNPWLDVLKISQCAGIAESSIAQFKDMATSCLNMRTLFLSRTPLPAPVLSRMLSPALAVLDLSDNSAAPRPTGGPRGAGAGALREWLR